MKKLIVDRNEIFTNIVMFMNYNNDVYSSIAKGILLEILKKRMMRGEVVRFLYSKMNGEIRHAVGSLQKQAVEANINGSGIPKRFVGMFTYLDMEKMAWRGFKTENFIGIID